MPLNKENKTYYNVEEFIGSSQTKNYSTSSKFYMNT